MWVDGATNLCLWFGKTRFNNDEFSSGREVRTGKKVVDLVGVGGGRLSP